MRLGKTNLEVNKNGFGALPIQRRNEKDSVEILKNAYDNGIDFYDTARFYTDSEEKMGLAFEDVRENIYIATKTAAEDVEGFWKDLETSLKNLKTDYVDLYQFHNLSFCPKEEDELYKAMIEAKNQGKIKHIGITTHKISHAHEALDSGLYETLQYPCIVNFFSQFNYGYDGCRYTSYDAFWECLNRLKNALQKDSRIGFPKNIGCGLGGANWNIIEKMIEEVLGKDFIVYIYELEEEKK